MDKEMKRITLEDVVAIFSDANDSTSAIRLIIPCYERRVSGSEINNYILDKSVEHFRSKGRQDGVYKLGHGLELVLDDHSIIWEEPPF